MYLILLLLTIIAFLLHRLYTRPIRYIEVERDFDSYWDDRVRQTLAELDRKDGQKRNRECARKQYLAERQRRCEAFWEEASQRIADAHAEAVQAGADVDELGDQLKEARAKALQQSDARFGKPTSDKSLVALRLADSRFDFLV